MRGAPGCEASLPGRCGGASENPGHATGAAFHCDLRETLPIMLHCFSKAIALLAAATFFAGCASVTVKNETVHHDRVSVDAPRGIYVADFNAKGPAFKIAGEGKKASARTASRTSDALAKATVQRLNKFVMPAARVSGDHLPDSGWLIRGRFDTVHSGSVPLRILLGLGVGRSTMQTTVYVYDLSRKSPTMAPFLTFQTTGGSGAAPGLVTIPLTGPVSAPMLVYDIGSKTYSEVTDGVKADTARTSRMIVAALSEYLARQGFIPESAEMKAKRDWTDSFTIPKHPLSN